jgi:metal-responsive CopG/Arc/MetJ family transcriptional regulator
MKTAISIPDEVYEAAERVAKALKVSRSKLYATAVREFVDRYRGEDVTEKLNDVYRDIESDAELDPVLQELQARSLDQERPD